MKLRTTILLMILAIVGTIIFMSTVGATSIGEFQQTKDVTIYQTCNNCTYCNFTRVMKPNNQTLFTNLSATKDGKYYFYVLAADNFTENGEYTYCYDCGNSVEAETGCLDFTITYSGDELTTQVALLYGLSIFTIIFLFIVVILFIDKLPSKDAVDETGVILQINQLKHLRPVMWGIAWALVMAMMFIVSNMTLAYLPNNMLGDFFFMIFKILFWMTIVAVPIWFIWIFTGIFRDREFKRMIERGVDIRSTP